MCGLSIITTVYLSMNMVYPHKKKLVGGLEQQFYFSIFWE